MFGVSDLKELKKLDKDDLLNLIGLETRKETTDYLLPALGAFTVGVLLGVGVGLMLAPKPGNELRNDLRNRFEGGKDTLTGAGTQRTETVTRGV
ncbi:YtxH domain-containing protein [Hyalangium gracile]|uniref:YtxH domain-containing protein n=1 Tax=Hyalangium gracile TaxID=394092 RepID=UPI001CCA438F|nr:YtxH domain-containing protein [Hyalangium gracile]